MKKSFTETMEYQVLRSLPSSFEKMIENVHWSVVGLLHEAPVDLNMKLERDLQTVSKISKGLIMNVITNEPLNYSKEEIDVFKNTLDLYILNIKDAFKLFQFYPESVVYDNLKSKKIGDIELAKENIVNFISGNTNKLEIVEIEDESKKNKMRR